MLSQEDSHDVSNEKQGVAYTDGSPKALRCGRLVENESTKTLEGSEQLQNEEGGKSSACTDDDWPDIKDLPIHLHEIYWEAILRLTRKQSCLLFWLLIKYADVSAKDDLSIRTFHGFVHWIRTGQAIPRRQGMRQTPLGFKMKRKKVLTSMLQAGVIEQSQSEWASAQVLVRKKNNTWRYCIDFRYLNFVSIKDAYPLPLMKGCIDSLSSMKWFCTRGIGRSQLRKRTNPRQPSLQSMAFSSSSECPLAWSMARPRFKGQCMLSLLG